MSSTTTILTEKETSLISTCISMVDYWVSIAKTTGEIAIDNCSWMTPEKLLGATGWSKESIGGVMSSLLKKKLIEPDDDDDYAWVNHEWAGRAVWYLTLERVDGVIMELVGAEVIEPEYYTPLKEDK